MSEANLLDAKYALDLKDIRVSISKKDTLEGLELSISPKGIIDITEIKSLNILSSFLQQGQDEHTQRLNSSGNLNIFAINDRIRLRMLEVFSNLFNQNIFKTIEVYWQKENEEEKKQIENLFSSVFIEDDSNPEIDELIRFWFSYNNPANTFYSEQFLGDHPKLDRISVYLTELINEMNDQLPKIDEENLFDFLTKPENKYPESIIDQINYIIKNWQKYLTDEALQFILLGVDLIREEEKFRGGGPGPATVYEFGETKASFIDSEFERFSEDQHWMPRLVLIAKNIHVWLDQLSKKYNTKITTLDQIPNRELDLLSSRGITGLWLVGIWERSPASKKIKQKTGNTTALSSAYSIYDYQIAGDLGGELAYDDLKKRLAKRNIRIGADMVPNHMGIDSKWVREHPDWFIQTSEKPFPSYTYNGEDLTDAENVEIYLEDHYYDQSDAAVTFKRVNSETGEVRYIYHGNDGTSLPWNDTAQIDFLNKEAREAIIQTIIDVAKKFPIIRFDAAMVLAKQHIRRLWYPSPGEGGDIPSRSQFSISDEEFHQAIPDEFWREVVDRVNEEAPDTLLLAEAFWLLEGYFVRTLGMHRVYNSAFMKMLQEEDNSDYRQTIKNVLEYDPEILKRFVNYLTTPDEEPAVRVFGTDDKYFGIATMMVTMPGLPMFGHGQFEGYAEKYGMEYAGSQMDEMADNELIDRHEIEIVPLLKRRYLFAGSDNFFLYDFFNADGVVNEDVFAYSNRYDGEKAIVIYNNTYAQAAGWVKRSVAFSEKLDDKTTRLRQVDLFEGLDLSNGEGYLLFKDHVTGLEYIRSKDDIREKGLYVEVGAFKYHVFVDLKEVYDNRGIWSRVEQELGGEGTDNLQSLYNSLSQTISSEHSVEVKEEIEEDNSQDDLITRLKVELSELKDENIALKGQIQAMNAEISVFKDESQMIKQLREQNASLRSNLQDVSKSAGSNEIKEFKNQIHNLKRENNQLIEKKDQMEAQIEILQSKNLQLKREITDLKSEVNDESELIKLKEENTDLNDQLASEISANAELEKQVQSLVSQIETLKKDINQLKSDKKELQEKLSEDTSTSDTTDTLLSSVLLETIKSRLDDAKTGIKLRNLAMSLGISASVCLNHVRTMEDKGQVTIDYKSTDDSNPVVQSTMV